MVRSDGTSTVREIDTHADNPVNVALYEYAIDRKRTWQDLEEMNWPYHVAMESF